MGTGSEPYGTFRGKSGSSEVPVPIFSQILATKIGITHCVNTQADFGHWRSGFFGLASLRTPDRTEARCHLSGQFFHLAEVEH